MKQFLRLLALITSSFLNEKVMSAKRLAENSGTMVKSSIDFLCTSAINSSIFG